MTSLPELETIELEPIRDPEPPVPVGSWLDRFLGLFGWIKQKKGFAVVVVVPTSLAALYFALFAADRYESVSQFVVRSPSTSAASQISSLVQGSGIVRSSDDAYIVHAFIRSRDAVRKLAADDDLLARLERPEADLLWRYPGFFNHNFERLWKHFQDLISLDYDQTTGITTLKVQGFRPDDAKSIAEALLADAEALINRLSERSRSDAVRAAAREVDEAREKARAALDRITEFRRKHSIIDPGRTSAAALETITRLSLEIALAKAQLAELMQASPNSPQANPLRLRIASLEAQITQERTALAGSDESLASLIAEYEQLGLEREFAERTFSSVQSAYDIARIDGERQRLFLERISSPSLPDYPIYPRRILGTFAVFIAAMMLYGVARRLLADTLAHAGN